MNNDNTVTHRYSDSVSLRRVLRDLGRMFEGMGVQCGGIDFGCDATWRKQCADAEFCM